MNKLTIGIYMRISNEYKSQNHFKQESDSITNQRDLIQEYITANETLNNCKVYEFVDDGFSGTNFNRPEFTNLMEQIKRGKINCVIVKDFSRFGRNYIEIGDYIERIFPFLGVRFISINDYYDSDTCKWLNNSPNIAMKNMIYDFYSKDMSIKIKTAKRIGQKKGFYLGGSAPYGFKKDINNKHKLIIDEEAAVIVRRIFNLALEGNNPRQIAYILNSEKILTPAQYYFKQNPNTKKIKTIDTSPAWNDNNVCRLLKQEVYYSAIVRHREEKITPGSAKRKSIPQNEVIIVENMHEAIISKEKWIKAQNSIGKGSSRSHICAREYLFKGKIKCGYCTRTLSYVHQKTNAFFKCKYALAGIHENCFGVRIVVSQLEKIVWNTLQNLFYNVDEIEKRILQNKEDNILDAINILNRKLEKNEMLFFY